MEKIIPFWNPSRQYLSIKNEVDTAMQDVLMRGDLVLREDVVQLEKDLADFLKVKYVVTTASGTDALIISLKAAGIKPGDEVITTAYTFRATVEAIHHAGAIAVLTDYGIDWGYQRTEKTQALIPAHIAGEVLPWESTQYSVIEDSCQAIGAKELTGLAACYSFYPAKILGCYGDGGAIATNSEVFANSARKLRNHFKDDWSGYGYNSRLDNIQAAVLNVKLKYLPDVIKHRREIALLYNETLSPYMTVSPVRLVYQDYIVEFFVPEMRDKMHAHLARYGIETMKNIYPFPNGTPKLPKAVDYESKTLRIPCNETLTEEEVWHIISSIKKFYGET